MPFPIFQRGENMFNNVWLQKLQTYFSVFLMDEEEGIKITSMFFDWVAYEWWHNGLTILGHGDIKSFE